MATKTVTTLDIQLLDADRGDTTTIKLDNPKDSLTREQVSAAMQPALVNGWLLTNKASVAMYLGDVTINQSIKTTLEGEDFYITPSSLTITTDNTTRLGTGTLTIAGANFMGYDYKKTGGEQTTQIMNVNIENNGLSINIIASSNDSTNKAAYDFYVIVQGEKIKVPVYINGQP